MEKQPFVAIDFETANELRRSPCSIGLVKFDADGTVIDTYDQLIDPHPSVNYFNPVNMWIHGISPEDVADAPEWNDIANDVRRFIEDLPLVAHNMPFDGSVLDRVTALYDLDPFRNRRLCTARIARKLHASRLTTFTLPDVFRLYFPRESFSHHDACADAEAAGRIFGHMQNELGFHEVSELSATQRERDARDRPLRNVNADELIAQYGRSTAFTGHRIAITGTLRHGQRAAIQQLISSIGATPDKGLTKKTTILIVGIPNPAAFAEGSSASHKLEKAEKLRASGSPIEVLTEEEFFNRLVDEL